MNHLNGIGHPFFLFVGRITPTIWFVAGSYLHVDTMAVASSDDQMTFSVLCSLRNLSNSSHLNLPSTTRDLLLLMHSTRNRLKIIQKIVFVVMDRTKNQASRQEILIP